MLCNRTAKLQHRMGEVCHFEMLRGFLPTAFSSCEAIIFLNLIVSAFVSSTNPFLADIDNACQIVIKGHASIKGAKDKKK